MGPLQAAGKLSFSETELPDRAYFASYRRTGMRECKAGIWTGLWQLGISQSYDSFSDLYLSSELRKM